MGERRSTWSDIMRRWLLGVIRRWKESRARAKAIREGYRTYDENKAKLEKGE